MQIYLKAGKVSFIEVHKNPNEFVRRGDSLIQVREKIEAVIDGCHIFWYDADYSQDEFNKIRDILFDGVNYEQKAE